MSAGTDIVRIEHLPGMTVNRRFLATLAAAQLTSFDRIFHFKGGEVVKQIQSRSITRFCVCSDTGQCIFYLKRHVANRPQLGELIESWVSGLGISPGIREFENIIAFKQNGIPTVIPVAAGERKVGRLRYESFLITESIDPFISLETIIRHFPQRLEGTEGKASKKILLAAIAALARKMHQSGFNHRDFNATHVLIGPPEENGAKLALFDLQRVDRKKWMRLHWMIKTMAELNYSLSEPVFNRQDRIFLFQSYINKERMSAWDRILFWRIARKTKKIERHTRKIIIRKEAAGRTR